MYIYRQIGKVFVTNAATLKSPALNLLGTQGKSVRGVKLALERVFPDVGKFRIVCVFRVDDAGTGPILSQLSDLRDESQ